MSYSTHAIIYKDVEKTSEASTSDKTDATTADKAEAKKASPKTGDATPIVAILAVMMMAGAGLVVIETRKRKEIVIISKYNE